MSREVRKVPPDWQHPRREDGRYQPMYDESYREAVFSWKKGYAEWEAGPREGIKADMEFWEYDHPPDPEYYRPDWPEESRTHYMMYETTSEGTPISPAFATPEELARWLADTGASAFAGIPASYEHWLRVCRGGYAPSAVCDAAGIRPGVAL